MAITLGFDAPGASVTPERVLDVWTEIVDRHALLACEVEYEGASEIYFRSALLFHPISVKVEH